MIASGFTRDGCLLGGRRVSYQTLQMDYRCNACGGQITMKWDPDAGGYRAACGRCGSVDFVHAAHLERQRRQATEVAGRFQYDKTFRHIFPKEVLQMIKDRPAPNRLVRAGIIRLGYRMFRCQRCNERVRWQPGAATCPKCGHTQRVDARWTYPQQADHFVLRDAPEIQAYYGPGGEPVRELDVMLLFPDIERNFDASYQVWGGGVLLCQGDGERVIRARPLKAVEKKGRLVVSQDTGEALVRDGKALRRFKWGDYEFAPGDPVLCPGSRGLQGEGYPHCRSCGMSAMLKVAMAVPELFRFAYYQLATGSWRNYENLLTTLQRVRGDYPDPATGEVIIGARPVNAVRYKLRLHAESTAYFDEQTGMLKPVEKYFLQMEPYPEDMLRLLEAERRRAIGAAAPRLLPPAEDFSLGPEEYPDLDGVEIEAPAPPPFAEVQRDEAESPHILDDEKVVDVEKVAESVTALFGDAPLFDEQEPAEDELEADDEQPASAPAEAFTPEPAEPALPAWVVAMREEAEAGDQTPVGAGAVKGLIIGLSRKVDGDQQRIRRFLTALWGREPEDMSAQMYRLTINLGDALLNRILDLEAQVSV